MAESERETGLAFKLKAFAFVEAVGLLISLVIPVTPSKTGKEFKWPESWGAYFDEVLLAFLVLNGLFVVLFIVGWIYVKRQKKKGIS